MDKSCILSNEQLAKMAHKLKLFIRILSKDELKDNLKYSNYIINLSDANKPGTHWTALHIDFNNNKLIYFDSMGVVPPETVQQCYPNYEIKYNKTQIQDINSTDCGWFCIAFLKYLDECRLKRQKGLTSDVATNDFIKMFYHNGDLKRNNNVLEKIVEKWII